MVRCPSYYNQLLWDLKQGLLPGTQFATREHDSIVELNHIGSAKCRRLTCVYVTHRAWPLPVPV